MNGVLVVDKPSGITSHDVVAVARRTLRERSIGHTGTLDPMATGVLPLAIGKATRLVRFLSASDKDYDAVIRFGRTTNSYDATGETTSESPMRPTRTAVEFGLLALSGSYNQMPPAYSAKKVDGRRAYAMARRDEPVELKAVPVTVSRALLTALDDDTASVSITCSAGFYVRSFAHELGRMLGCGACLDALRRTRSGEFTLASAMPFDELAAPSATALASRMIPCHELLPDYPAVELNDQGLAFVSNGRDLGPAQVSGRLPADTTPASWVRLMDARGTLVALATPDAASGVLHPSIVLLS
ncbi:MAG TPA: tRNA pseudouridine(55) synthase TruB [Vicinamibacterales bacterium]|nr:tRNA pseudouridine(55) synthase TruB [Vicinamibacterales bacterium]